MKSTGITVIGQRDIYQRGLTATLGTSRFKVVRELDIEEPSRGAGLTNASSLMIVIEPRNQVERTKQIVASLRNRFASACIVVISYENDDDRWTKEPGVDSCLPRTISSRALLLSLELVLCREVAVGIQSFNSSTGPCRSPATIDSSSHPGDTTLSVREQEILSWLARGQSNKVIARGLEIEEATVKAHVRTILRKTGASNRTQAAMMANALLLSPNINSTHGAH